MIQLPRLRQVPSPNYSPISIRHQLIIVHMCEGGYQGSVAYCALPSTQATAHLFMSEDGSEVTQCVPLMNKAWAECQFNGLGVSLEIPGFTKQGVPQARWEAAAQIVAWLALTYGIPVKWAMGGQGTGICQHADLGAAGGGHIDACGIGSQQWLDFLAMVEKSETVFLAAGELAAWALHGLPAPHTVELPPNVTPTPSHFGAARIAPGVTPDQHQTISGFPEGSTSDWQWRLKRVGVNPVLDVDGLEGTATRNAIGTYQRAVGLFVTNDVNPETWASLKRMSENLHA